MSHSSSGKLAGVDPLVISSLSFVSCINRSSDPSPVNPVEGSL